MAKRRHIWVKTGTPGGHPAGSGQPDFCQKCGTDRTPKTENAVCHPTRLPGF
jgi:hypothetical protein